METHARTILKSLTWRTAALAITSTIAWAVTGKFELAAAIGLADTVVKLVAYYGHERLWLRVAFGRPRRPEYEI